MRYSSTNSLVVGVDTLMPNLDYTDLVKIANNEESIQKVASSLVEGQPFREFIDGLPITDLNEVADAVENLKSLSVGTVTEGTTPSVAYNNATGTLDFVLPKGIKGDQGNDGISASIVQTYLDGILTVTTSTTDSDSNEVNIDIGDMVDNKVNTVVPTVVTTQLNTVIPTFYTDNKTAIDEVITTASNAKAEEVINTYLLDNADDLKGEKGDTGDKGDSVEITDITNNSDGSITIEFSDSTVHTTDNIRGLRGLTGPRGVGIESITLVDDNLGNISPIKRYRIDLSDNSYYYFEITNAVTELSAVDRDAIVEDTLVYAITLG
jgi:hypothetical protein